MREYQWALTWISQAFSIGEGLMTSTATFSSSALTRRHSQSVLTPRKASPSSISPDIRDALLATIPSLRAFAISLTGSLDQADDLVQEALVRALSNIHRFEPGTCLEAWLFTILRNQFHTAFRKRRR